MSRELDFDQEKTTRGPLPVRRETGPLMFLSLFLLLLAFFILLNAISTLRETKSRKVLSSVASTFQADTDPDQDSEILVSTIGPVLGPEKVLDEVERLWLAEVPFVPVKRVTNGLDIVVEMPIVQIFVGGEARLRSDRKDLVRATAHVLSTRIPDQTVIMQAILYVDALEEVPLVPDPDVLSAAAEPVVLDARDPESGAQRARTQIFDGTDLAFIRAGLLARGLIDGGAPASSLEVGLREGNVSRIRFRFYIRDAARAHLTFAEDVRTQ